MLIAQLEQLGLVCPTCRSFGRPPPPLALGTIARALTSPDGDDVIEGALVCPGCMREHPIIDGIAVVVADAKSWAEHQLDPILRRSDFSPFMESLLADAIGRGGSFDRERHDLSNYATSHWGDRAALDPIDPIGSMPSLTATAFALLPSPPSGRWLDLGCALGRASFELLAAGAESVVGVDLNMAMLRRAEGLRRTGRIEWPRRRVGLVFDRASAEHRAAQTDRVAFVCADVLILPFADGAFAGALSFNVLDCVPSPLSHLTELGRMLAPGAPALLSTPYDWSSNATAMEAWIGGHSQRSDTGGASEPEMRRILSPDLRAGVDTGLVIADERDDVPWRLTLNARSTMHYRLHLLRLARRSDPSSASGR
jgi:SAM-dependent methyltransferase